MISDHFGSFPENLKKEHERIVKNGATPLVVYQDNAAIGIIAVSDPLMPDAKKTLEKLKKAGISRIGLLSGDHEQAVAVN